MQWLGFNARNSSRTLDCKFARITLIIACFLLIGSLLLPVGQHIRTSVISSGKVEVQHKFLNTFELLKSQIEILNLTRKLDLLLSTIEGIAVVVMTVFQGIVPLLRLRALQADRRFVKYLFVVPTIGILHAIWNFDSSFQNPLPPLNIPADLVWMVGVLLSVLGILRIPHRSNEVEAPLNRGF